jgi:hypothetical protein
MPVTHMPVSQSVSKSVTPCVKQIWKTGDQSSYAVYLMQYKKCSMSLHAHLSEYMQEIHIVGYIHYTIL